MTDVDDSYVLSRLQGLAGRADESLLALLALGRLATAGDREMRWSEAEVTLVDLLARFGATDLAVPGEVSAARAFTGLSSDHFWVLDAEVPGDRVRVLDERHVTAPLDPALEKALLANPVLFQQAGRMLVAGSFRRSKPTSYSRRSAFWFRARRCQRILLRRQRHRRVVVL